MGKIKYFSEDLNVQNKTIILRLDLNVPLNEKKIQDKTRILLNLSFLKDLIKKKAKIIIISHLGRPKGKYNKDFSLMPVGEHLASLLEIPIKFSSDCISQDAIDTSLSLKPGEVHLLENLRFHKE